MPNPKRKHTASRRDSRRAANWRLTARSLSRCANCGAMRLPHRLCSACGFYDGQLILPVKPKGQKKKAGEGESGGEKPKQ